MKERLSSSPAAANRGMAHYATYHDHKFNAKLSQTGVVNMDEDEEDGDWC